MEKKYIISIPTNSLQSFYWTVWTHRTQKASLRSTVRLNPVWNDRNDSNTSSVWLRAVFR